MKRKKIYKTNISFDKIKLEKASNNQIKFKMASNNQIRGPMKLVTRKDNNRSKKRHINYNLSSMSILKKS